MQGYREVKVVLGAVFAFMGLINAQSASAAIAPGMEFLGRTSLDKLFHDSDVIDLGPCGTHENSPVRAVQIEVRFAPVQIEEIAVQFGDGSEQRLPVHEFFSPDSSSRVFDLPGDTRCVRRVYVTGRTLEVFGPQAAIAIYGTRFYGGGHGDGDHDRDRGDHGRDFEGRRFLGATSLDDHHDHDIIRLGNCFRRPGVPGMGGRDSARVLQFRVTGNDAEIHQVIVVYGSGQAEEIRIRPFFEQNSSSDPKDLAGQRRCIQEIMVSGRTINNHRYGFAEARFEVYALE